MWFPMLGYNSHDRSPSCKFTNEKYLFFYSAKWILVSDLAIEKSAFGSEFFHGTINFLRHMEVFIYKTGNKSYRQHRSAWIVPV